MSHLNQPHFQCIEKAREYLERLRWQDGPICPHCGVVGKHYALQGEAHRKGLMKCKDCRKQFSATVGTVFERSHVALNVWLQAAFLMSSSKKGMSAHQLHRMLGLAFFGRWLGVEHAPQDIIQRHWLMLLFLVFGLPFGDQHNGNRGRD